MDRYKQEQILYKQEQILNIRPKNVRSRITPFYESPLTESEYFPELVIFTGNTASVLSVPLILAAGRLQVSPVYFSKVLKTPDGMSVNHNTVKKSINKQGVFIINDGKIQLSTDEQAEQTSLDREGIFLIEKGKTQLRTDGQTNQTSFFKINPQHNNSILAGATAFTEVFNELTDDEIVMWKGLTGSKNMNSSNPANALEIIRKLVESPDNKILLSTEEGAANQTNSLYAASRRMEEFSAVEFSKDSEEIVSAIDGREIPAYYARIASGYHDVFYRFADIIKEYRIRVNQNLESGFGGLFDIEINEENHFGIRPERMDLIAKALRIYNLQSFSPRT